MLKFWLALLTLLFAATSAHAERLDFDHRIYPPLKAVVDSGDKDMLAFDDRNPARLVDLIAIIAEDAATITFQRSSPNCPAERAETGIYRLVAGQRSWFQLAVLVKGQLDQTSRRQWLALLASARLNRAAPGGPLTCNHDKNLSYCCR